MKETFDPYQHWLGIAPEDQPPNHYRLLGLALFEDDPDAIAAAADRQMRHVRIYQTGRYSLLSQDVLNELAAARVCLLDAQRKAQYDAALRQALTRPWWKPTRAALGGILADAPAWPSRIGRYCGRRRYRIATWTALALGTAMLVVAVTHIIRGDPVPDRTANGDLMVSRMWTSIGTDDLAAIVQHTRTVDHGDDDVTPAASSLEARSPESAPAEVTMEVAARIDQSHEPPREASKSDIETRQTNVSPAKDTEPTGTPTPAPVDIAPSRQRVPVPEDTAASAARDTARGWIEADLRAARVPSVAKALLARDLVRRADILDAGQVDLRFAAVSLAAEMKAQVGDLSGALRTARRLAEQYECDRFELALRLIDAAKANVTNDSDATLLLLALRRAVGEAIDAQATSVALEMAEQGLAIARQTRDGLMFPLFRRDVALIESASGSTTDPGSLGEKFREKVADVRHVGKLDSRDAPCRYVLLDAAGGGTTEQAAAAGGILWLLSQQRDDGSWPAPGRPDVTATTAVGLWPLVGAWPDDDAPALSEAIRRAVWYLRDNMTVVAPGVVSWGDKGSASLTSHAWTTLAMVESAQWLHEHRYREANATRNGAQAAVRLLERLQNRDGGWPATVAKANQRNRGKSDTHTTLWSVAALATTQRCGLDVAARTMAAAERYFDSIHSEDEHRWGFRSAPGEPTDEALRPLGTWVGLEQGWIAQEAPQTMTFFDDMLSPALLDRLPPRSWWHTALAFRFADRSQQERFHELLRAELLARQHTSGANQGAWHAYGDHRILGNLGAAAFSTLTLQAAYRYPPPLAP